jgi:hypothetical protein
MEWGLLFGFIVVAVGVSIIAGAGVHALFPSISEDFGGSLASFVIIVVVGYLLTTRLRQKEKRASAKSPRQPDAGWKHHGGN